MVSSRANPRVGGTEVEEGGGTDVVLRAFPPAHRLASKLAAVASVDCDCGDICCEVELVPPSLAKSLSSSDTFPLE